MSALLWPNFAAEERTVARLPPDDRLIPLAQAWALLFGSDVGVQGAAVRRPDWMRGDEPVFKQLQDYDGLVPWLSTPDTTQAALDRGQRHVGPPPEVARAIGDKAWALGVARALSLEPAPLAGVARAFEPSELQREAIDDELARWPDALRSSWTLKPRHGSSGRGRVKGRGPRLDDDGARALPRLVRTGGAVLEPWVERDVDLSAQVWVPRAGAPTLVATTVMLNSRSGLWMGNTGVLTDAGPRSGHEWDDTLVTSALAVAQRAQAAGFYGPLGVDAFGFDLDGPRLRALVEVNARFTTGLVAVGALLRARDAGHARTGSRWTFRFASGDGDDDGDGVQLPVVVDEGPRLTVRG